MSRSAMMANIGFVMNTGRNNLDTTDAVFQIAGAEDYSEFVRKIRSANESILLQVLQTIDRMQPGTLPAGAL